MSYFGNPVYPTPLLDPSEIVYVISSTSLTSTSYGRTFIVTSAGATTMTLMPLSSAQVTEQVTFINDSTTGVVTVNTSGSDTIRLLGSSVSTLTLNSGDVIVLENNGTNWSIVNHVTTPGNAPAAGNFTTLSASSTVSGAGFSNYMAAPPPIGSTTPNTGAFTTLSATSTVSGSGFSTYFASPPALGSTAPNTGAFTTLTASSTVSGTGFSTYMAAPPPIGSTTANTGAFTTLSASGTVSGAGFTNYFAAPPAIGGTTPSTGAFTTLSSSGTFTASGTLTASGTVNGTGFTSYLAAPPPIGSTTPNTGAFTTLSASGTVSGSGFSSYLASPPAIGSVVPAAGSFTTLNATSITNSGLTANSFTYSGAGGLMSTTAAPTNGQILIGSTGAAPIKATITGTSNQVVVTNGSGSITLSTPQDIATVSSPTFVGATLSGLTANSFMYSGTGGAVTSTAAPTNGQLLIGSTGAAPVKATLTGTANQINVTNGAGSITLAIPSTFAIPGTISSVNGISTVGNGVAIQVANVALTNQTANIPTTALYTVPAGQGGRYRVTMNTILMTPASTSSTLPQSTIFWTDSDSSGTPSANIGATSTGNTTSSASVGNITVYAKAGTAINVSTSTYASSPANTMAYNARYLVDFLGP